jgi:hypothetical protein
MSVLTLPARPGQEAGQELPPVPWRRMLWVTWRQHRGMLVSVTAVLMLAMFAGPPVLTRELENRTFRYA